MFGVSRLTALILSFCIGIIAGAGLFAAGASIALSTFTLRDLEDNNIIPIPDEMFIGDNPEVSLLDLTGLQLYDEYMKLQTYGDDVNLNFVQKRYDLLFHQELDNLLSDKVREMPLRKLFSQEGINTILATVYIGNIEHYECWDSEGNKKADPEALDSYWVNPKKDYQKLSLLEQKIANWTLATFMSGGISADAIIKEFTIGEMLGYEMRDDNQWYDRDGNKVTGVIASFAGSKVDTVDKDLDSMIIGELLGYTKGEDGNWYDSSDNKITGVMSVFVDSELKNINSTLKNAMLGELLGYERLDDGKWYDSDGNKLTGAMAALADCHLEGEDNVTDKINTVKIGALLGYEEVSEGVWKKLDSSGNPTIAVDGFMTKVSCKTLSNVDQVFNDLVIADVITNRTGVLSIIPADTKLNGINDAVTNAIKTTPLQFFINEGLITFDNASFLDSISTEISVSTEDYEKYYKDVDTDYDYLIHEWRTKPLSQSFSFITSLITNYYTSLAP